MKSLHCNVTPLNHTCTNILKLLMSLVEIITKIVINICLDIPANLGLENMVDKTLVCGVGIFEAKGHDLILVH